MIIANIEEALNREQWWVKPGVDLYKAFPDLYEREGHRAGYTKPTHAMKGALILLWLEWHQGIRYEQIMKKMKFIIERGIQVNKDPMVYQLLREDHDNFMIQLSILTGIKRLMIDVCESVIEADPNSQGYQYLQAWTGILKYRILGNQDKVLEQYEIMQRFKSTRIFLWPLDKLVGSFVDRDYKTFNSVLKRSCERQWKWSEKEKAISRNSNGELVLDAPGRHEHFMWPWVEGAFAKLAFMDGADIKYDSLWLPLDLVKAVEQGEACGIS